MSCDRTLLILMALIGAFFSAHLGTTAAIIGGAVAAWIIACTFIPEQETPNEYRHDPAHATTGSEPH